MNSSPFPVNTLDVATAANAVHLDSAQLLGLSQEDPSDARAPELVSVSEEITSFAFEVYKDTCFQCTGFNPMGSIKIASRKCRADNGNALCPAGVVTVTIAGPRQKILNELKRARDTFGPSSPQFLASLSANTEALLGLSDSDREQVMKAISLA